MKVNLRTTMAYFTLSCAASFLLLDVFIRIKREKKPERERKKMIVYILQESFSIDQREKETSDEESSISCQTTCFNPQFCLSIEVESRYNNMQKVIECVPNFSEGQRKEVRKRIGQRLFRRLPFHSQVIDTIAHAIAGVEGVALLDIDPGLSTNRTIYSRERD